MNDILVVGSLAFDDLEMPSGIFENVLGGAATYAALAASILAPVRIVGVVGEDYPHATLEDLRKRNIDTAGVEHAKGRTFRWRGRYAADLGSRETLDTQLNVFQDFRPKIQGAHKTSPYVFLANIHPVLQMEVLDQVESPKLVICDTMNFWIGGERDALVKVLPRVNILVINDEEVRQLTGEHNIVRAAQAARKLGPQCVIVKRGEHGALLFDDHGTFFAPAYPLEEVLDPTGAGDSFAGGLVGYLARDGEISPACMRRAMFVATACGSLCVERVGPAELFETNLEKLGRRLESLMSLVNFGGPFPTLAAR